MAVGAFLWVALMGLMLGVFSASARAEHLDRPDPVPVRTRRARTQRGIGTIKAA